MRERNRKKLLDAPSAAIFWKEIKKLSDPAPIPVSVTAEALRNVFEKRLNPPEHLPESFDATEHKFNRLLAILIPETTIDSSNEGFFSAEWTEEDTAEVKDHIRKHGLASATGEDAILYGEILEIPNDALAYLCNDCIRRRDGPSICCVLKLLTLLIHKRITKWAIARGLIPDYQNGFREGYRTNNNPFILRCVKEWARANGFTVYVAAVDATNAFPSTDHPTLWLKLIRMGMGGAIFD
ncbi:hypothetical protein DFH07DRAFT_752880, partial [Mycena maculata]